MGVLLYIFHIFSEHFFPKNISREMLLLLELFLKEAVVSVLICAYHLSEEATGAAL